MKISINVLMILLFAIFIASLVSLIVYGEVWRINLLMTDTNIESFDPVRTRNAFILSCVSIVTGASMLYILVTRFSPEEEKKQVPVSRTTSE